LSEQGTQYLSVLLVPAGQEATHVQSEPVVKTKVFPVVGQLVHPLSSHVEHPATGQV